MTTFISYSGDLDRVGSLVQVMRRHGLRTWRDRDRLGQGSPTQADIESALRSCDAAMVWLGGNTMSSDFVRNIELPLIFEHHRERRLRIVPLFVDVDVDEGVEQVRSASGEEVGSHNGYRWDTDRTDDDNFGAITAAEVAAVLATRATPRHRPVVRLVTRSDGAGGREDADLNFDWVAEYPGNGELPTDSVVESLREGLHTSGLALISSFGTGSVDLYLRCHLHLAVALGFEFRRTTGLQPRVELDGHWFDVAMVEPVASAEQLVTHSDDGPAGSSRVAVELAVSRDVRPIVNTHVASAGMGYRRRILIRPPAGPDQQAVNGENFNAWAEQAANAIRDARSLPGVIDVDVFLASPVAFAVALGWRLNAVGGVHLFHPMGNAGPYAPVWDLPPS
ncbi:MAG TPA: SAVED domain-containing protein [Microthrixaceae bacterium]|nr:SAVED domain-containing protein [Microthrixaceae bacterium]